jgi:WbqC-like protein family
MHQPHYLPYLGLIHRISLVDLFVYVDHVQFTRGGWQNRNLILTNKGCSWLTVPVSKQTSNRISDVLVLHDKNWQRKHVETIYHAYHKAPYFSFIKSILEDIREVNAKYLADMNIQLMETLLRKFDLNIPYVRSSELDIDSSLKKNEMIIAILDKLGATKFICGDGAKGYINQNQFHDQEIRFEWQGFNHPHYPQFNQNAFTPQICSLDMLVNCGGKSGSIIKKC